jgi:aminoglycoside phosphotransferase (APT) family kinase protein
MTATLTAEQHEALAAWLQTNLGGDGPLEVTPIGVGQGTANVLMRVVYGDFDVVLRCPPASTIIASAGSVSREATLLEALGRTEVRHARFVARCDDPAVIGTPFLLMERIDGFVPADPLPGSVATDDDFRAAVGPELVDALAGLATADWRAIGLDGFGKPDGFLQRQVERWLWQLDSYRCRDVEHLDDVVDWLKANLPAPGPIGVMHGDYSTFNVMFDAADPYRLRAIIDWDTATIGEVLMDFGHLLSRWDDPGDEPTTLGSSDLADRTRLASRRDLVDRYAEATGYDLTGIRYYEVLSLFKLGCIMEGQYAKHMETTPEAPMGKYTNIGPGLFADAHRIAAGVIHP